MASTNIEVFEGQAHNVLGSSGLIVLGRGRIGHIAVMAGSADAVVLLYDGRDTSGTVLFAIGSPSAEFASHDFNLEIRYDSGLYAAITGAGARVFVSWLPTG